VQTAAFTTGQVADDLLLVAALEVEAAQVGARRHFEAADAQDVGAAGHVFKHGLGIAELSRLWSTSEICAVLPITTSPLSGCSCR
jgi:hypothetical protein